MSTSAQAHLDRAKVHGASYAEEVILEPKRNRVHRLIEYVDVLGMCHEALEQWSNSALNVLLSQRAQMARNVQVAQLLYHVVYAVILATE